jgi:Family of unknown function (DUF6789)
MVRRSQRFLCSNTGRAPRFDASTAVRAAARGGIGGVVATGLMSIPFLVATSRGWTDEQPPKRISNAALDRAGIDADEPAQNAVATVSHFGYGTSMGAVFGVLYAWRRPRGPAVLHGIGFAIAVWLLSYQGWTPALGLHPPITRDDPRRQAVALIGHLVYGSVLGAAFAR